MTIDRSNPLPLHVQLRDALARRIVGGELPLDARLPSVRALIGAYGVSLPVVQAALEALRAEGVIATEHGRGSYVRRKPEVDAATQALLVLVHGRSALDPFFSRVLAGVERAARAARRAVLFRGDPQGSEGIVDLLGEIRPAGVVATGDIGDAEHRRLARIDLPFVVVGNARRTAMPDDVSWVVNDDALGGRLAGERLIAAGHRRLAIVTGPTRQWFWRQRRTGFEQAIAAAGATAIAVEVDADTSDAGHAAVARLIARARPPTAIFAGNDRYAHGAYRALAERGLVVPRDCAIVGFDDLELAGALLPPLTTVHADIERMGEDAVGLLLERIAGAAPRGIVRAVRLVERGSVAPAR